MHYYSVSQSGEVHLKTSPPTPLLIKERGEKQSFIGVRLTLYLSSLINAIVLCLVNVDGSLLVLFIGLLLLDGGFQPPSDVDTTYQI